MNDGDAHGRPVVGNRYRSPRAELLGQGSLTLASLLALAVAVGVGIPPLPGAGGDELRARVGAGADTCLVLAGAVVLSAALLTALRQSDAGPFAAQALSAALACWSVGLLPSALLDLRATGVDVADRPHLDSAMTWMVVVVLLAAGARWTGVGWAPPWLVGAAAGALVNLVGPGVEQLVPIAATARLIATGVTLAGVVTAVAVVVRRFGTPSPLVGPLGTAVALLGAGDVVRAIDPGVVAAVGGAILTVAGGALVWVVAARVHRAAFAIDHRRILDQCRRAQRAEETDREARERLHEVSATVAGLAHASRLIAPDSGVDDVSRRRLALLVDGELARVDRLAGGRRGGRGRCRPDHVVELLATSLALQGHHIDHTCGDAEVAVEEDVFLELLHVLLLNGVRHAGGRGLRVRCRVRGRWLAVLVEDDGPGVPTGLRSRIFAWGEARSDSPGQGIGLAGARRLAVEVGGELELTEPEEGTGAAFLLLLPVVDEQRGSVALAGWPVRQAEPELDA